MTGTTIFKNPSKYCSLSKDYLHCAKVSVFGVILVCIFLHSDWITLNTDTFYAVLMIHIFSIVTPSKKEKHVYKNYHIYFKYLWNSSKLKCSKYKKHFLSCEYSLLRLAQPSHLSLKLFSFSSLWKLRLGRFNLDLRQPFATHEITTLL